jgi:multidrug efflux pump
LIALAIRRPVATTLLAVGVMLAGLGAFMRLQVSPLPNVDFPVIEVQARVAGASPETMAATVAAPLERRLGSIAGVTEMHSINNIGSTEVDLEFALGRDIDGAARDVQAAINAARSDLPTNLTALPVYRKANPTEAPILIIALTSRTLGQGQLYDAANSVLVQKLSQIAGVGLVNLRGSSLPGVRVEVNPGATSAMSLGLEDIRAALEAANANRPKGAIESGDLRYQLYASDQGRRASDYRDTPIAYRNGAAVRLSDVAEVTDSVEDVRAYGIANGRPAIVLLVYKQAGANIVDTTDRVKAALPALQAALPGDVHLTFAGDRSATIRAALADTERTLVLGVLLVMLVVFGFLRNHHAVLIPGVAVASSIVGTLAAMYLLGYSLNNLTLMALTIAAGFVIDDAIVVLENVTRHMEAGVPRLQAVLQGTREVAFTVLSMSASLVAVFLPLLLLGGIAGRLFHEFAMTLSLSIAISLALSLTLTPMMCGRFLQVGAARQDGRIARAAAATLEATQRVYARSLALALEHPAAVMLILIATVALNVELFLDVPKGFFPEQDSGLILGKLRADQSISFAALKRKMAQVEDIIRHDPAVESVVTFAGGSDLTSATVFVRLKPLSQRVSAAAFMARLRPRFDHLAGTHFSMFSIQDLFAQGGQTQGQFQFTLQSDSTEQLYEWTAKLVDVLKRDPHLADVTEEQQPGLKATLSYDRGTLARYGLTPANIDATLYDALGQRQVATIYDSRDQYHVVMEVAPRYQQHPDALGSLFVSTTALSSVAAVSTTRETMVPLSALGRIEPSMSPTQVYHQGLGVGTPVSFNLAPGHTLSEASAAIERAIASLRMPKSVHGGFTGSAGKSAAGAGGGALLIVASLGTVYLVLGMLYESYVHPITILSTLPSAGIGAIAALMLAGMELTIIALIGVILLIGIVKKNAIMMIDFALQAERDRGLSPADAIYEACLIRFRPIMMTTLAALFSAVPMILDRGAGSELRRPLGISIAGGLIVSQLLTLYTTPVVYLYLDRFRLWLAGLWRRRETGGPGNGNGITGAARHLGMLASLGVLVLLTGCMIGPDYRRPPAPVPARYKELPPPPPDWTTAAPADDVDRGSWWSTYDDPLLDQLEQQVNINNQNLKGFEAAYRQALAVAAGARSGLLPSAALTSGATRARSSAVTTSTSRNVEASASWDLDLWGKVRRQVESDRAAAQASAAQLAAIRLSAQAELATDYFQLRYEDSLQRLLSNAVSGYQRSLEITRNQLAAGVAARSDVVAAQTQLQTTQAQLIAVGVSRAQYEHAIALLTGKTPADLAIPVAPLRATVPNVPVTLPSALLERRPDIAQAERTMQQQNALIGVAAAAYFPDLNLSAMFGYVGNPASGLITASNKVWSLAANGDQILFDGGARSAKLAAARAAYDQSIANYLQTVLAAFQDVEDALSDVRILAQEAEAQAQAVALSREGAQIALREYQAGLQAYTAVVTAESTALANEETELQVHASRLTASVALLKALGGGWNLK